jgi:RNA polymerase sigma-70 factor (ECF subfamily)
MGKQFIIAESKSTTAAKQHFMTDDFVPLDSPSVTSLTLLERARDNESDAWRLLVDLYCPLVYWRCRCRWNMVPADAENVGQDVFSAVARKLKDFQRGRTGSFRNWLLTITDNKCRDHLRKHSPDLLAAGGSVAKSILDNVPDENCTGNHPASEDSAELPTEQALLMRQAMKLVEHEFSHRDWQIFWCIAVENRHRQDVALQCGVSSNVVYLAYSRIRKRMREVFQDLIDDDLIDDDPK